jgi:chromosome segregation ATPase
MSSGVSVDEFQALEQKVLRAVEIVKREREARTAAETEVVALREQLAAQTAAGQSQVANAQSQIEAAESRAQAIQREKETAESQIAALNQDREAVRQRVEKMLQQMDELV